MSPAIFMHCAHAKLLDPGLFVILQSLKSARRFWCKPMNKTDNTSCILLPDLVNTWDMQRALLQHLENSCYDWGGDE